METIITKLLWHFSKTIRARYSSTDESITQDCRFHINFYTGYGLLSTTMSLFNKWYLLALPLLAVQAIYRECISDGHLRRIKLGVETPEELLDFKADLITRLGGLVLPIILGVVCLLS